MQDEIERVKAEIEAGQVRLGELEQKKISRDKAIAALTPEQLEIVSDLNMTAIEYIAARDANVPTREIEHAIEQLSERELIHAKLFQMTPEQWLDAKLKIEAQENELYNQRAGNRNGQLFG